jgi:hypothetical protein
VQLRSKWPKDKKEVEPEAVGGWGGSKVHGVVRGYLWWDHVGMQSVVGCCADWLCGMGLVCMCCLLLCTTSCRRCGELDVQF